MQHITHSITADSPGTSISLSLYHFAPAADQNRTEQPKTYLPKVHLQAGLHADEHPGVMILHHLLNHLEHAEKQGRLAAEFIIAPVVNPLGLAHLQFHSHRGRYHPLNGLNYNRDWPDLDALLWQQAGDLSSELGSDPAANKAFIRQKLADILQAQDGDHPGKGALAELRHLITRIVIDCDMVLDLHCDDAALNHLYMVPQLWPDASDLSAFMGAEASFLEEDSGGGSFDEVWPGLWLKLARRYPEASWPELPVSATLEYRGQADVSDALGAADAHHLLQFFEARGLIEPEAGEPAQPPALLAPATALKAAEFLRCPYAGLLAYQVELGDMVQKGDVVAELIQLDGPEAARGRLPIKAGTSGKIIALKAHKYIWPGESIAKIAGSEVLASRTGRLLDD